MIHVEDHAAHCRMAKEIIMDCGRYISIYIVGVNNRLVAVSIDRHCRTQWMASADHNILCGMFIDGHWSTQNIVRD